MVCSINDITFGHTSKEGFEKVKEIYRTADVLASALSGGVFVQLFFNNGPIATTYSISHYDFVLFSRSMSSIPQIAKRMVDHEVGEILLHGTLTSKEKEFWNCIKNAH